MKGGRLGSILVDTLLKSATPLSVKELFVRIRMNELQYSTRSVRRALAELHEKKIVKRSWCEHKWQYALNDTYVSETLRRTSNYLQATAPISTCFQGKKQTYTFTSFKELDTFLDAFEVRWMKEREQNEYHIFYSLLYNRQCLQPTVPIDYKKHSITHFVACKSNTFGSRKLEGKWLNRNAAVSLGADVQDTEFYVYGKYLISVEYEPFILEHLDEVFELGDQIVAGDVLENIRGTIRVTVDAHPFGGTVAKLVLEKVIERYGRALGDIRRQIDDGHTYLKLSMGEPYTDETIVANSARHFSKMTDGRREVIEAQIQHIIEAVQDAKRVAVIDYGSGKERVSAPITRAIAQIVPETRHIDLDISPPILKRAAETARGDLGPAVDYHQVEADFYDLRSKEGAAKVLDLTEGYTTVHCILGTTIDNHEETDAIAFLQPVMRSGDKFLIDFVVREGLDIEAQLAHYRGDVYFNMSPFTNAGLHIQYFVTEHAFSEDRGAIVGVASFTKESYARAKQEVPHVLLDAAGFQEHHQTEIYLGKRLFLEQQRRMMETLARNGNVRPIALGTGPERSYGVAFGSVGSGRIVSSPRPLNL